LWLSTNKGLSRFDPQSETFRNYGVSDGLQGYEFSRACYKGRWGEMFFGGMNGFNAFYPAEVQDNLYVPPVVLTSLTQGGEAVDLERALEEVTHVTFRWPKNFFEFEFAALSYVQPEKNRYAYKLEGFDEAWNYIGTRRFGRYTNLEGGTYTLRLNASNNDGVWNETGAVIRVTIVPPLWKAWWFRAGIVLLLGAVLVAGYRVRVRSIAARTHELESQVEARTSEIECRRQELEALYRADEELYQHLRLDQVLRALVDIAVDILGADKSYLMVWDAPQARFVVRFTRGFASQALDDVAFAPEVGVVGQVVRTGEPTIVGDVAVLTQDACAAKRVIASEGVRTFMYVPIKVQGQIFGVLSADYGQPHTFDEDEQRLFMALAQRAALVIEKAQLHEQTQALAVMEERNRLARDLHDAVTQTLFSASLIAEVLPSLWDQDEDEGRQLLKELRQLSRGALAEMRTLLLELRPAALMDANLDDLLRQLVDAVVGRTGLPVQLTVEGACSLPPEVHVALYRIAQEALNNVVKHARASHVSVTMRAVADEVARRDNDAGQLGRVSGRVELCVVDDGLGFDPACVPSDRLGLNIIRERAQSIGATLRIESAPGAGTRVAVVWQEERRSD
jgi:signal transduction histidine kinase